MARNNDQNEGTKCRKEKQRKNQTTLGMRVRYGVKIKII
jgi:hypothetical protein